MSDGERAQRLRITYRKGGMLRYIAHLDLMRTWERALRRARLPLAYTQGFSPHARMALGAALAVGFEGERELMDVWMSPAIAPADVVRALGPVMPQGLEVRAVEEIAHEEPSLQSAITSALYELTFAPGALDPEDLRWRVGGLLAAHEMEWEEERGGKTRRYDLRAAVRNITVEERAEGLVVTLDLELREGLVGRPPSVLEALGVREQPVARRRIELRLGEPAPVAAGGGAS